MALSVWTQPNKTGRSLVRAASLRACWAFCGAAAAALSPVATASRNQRKGATKGPTNLHARTPKGSPNYSV